MQTAKVLLHLPLHLHFILGRSSPNWLIEYFMKARQGLGTKDRLRRKHRRDIVFHIYLARLPQSAAGAGKERSGG
jgi:hypothetical protein